MNLAASDLTELADLAMVAATEAGQMIARSRPQNIQHKEGADSMASQVVTEVDRQSEDLILEILSPTLERFDLGLLAEEHDDNGSRFDADHFWCIDPLDGTLPFIEGIPGYAVSIALVDKAGTPWIGVVFDPVEATLYHAIRGSGAFRNRQPWVIDPQPASEVLSVFADRSLVIADEGDLFDDLERVAHDRDLTGLQLHTTGGAVMNACQALANGPACYFKFPKPVGGGSLWDFAATACLAQEVRAVATDIHGDPLDLNRAGSTFMNHRGVLFATDEALAQRLRAIHQSRTGGSGLA